MSAAALSQAECSIRGKQIRRFDADEIVAFARLFKVPLCAFFAPPEPHLVGQRVMINGKPGNPKARVTCRALSRDELVELAIDVPQTAPKNRRDLARQEAGQIAMVQAAIELLSRIGQFGHLELAAQTVPEEQELTKELLRARDQVRLRFTSAYRRYRKGRRKR